MSNNIRRQTDGHFQKLIDAAYPDHTVAEAIEDVIAQLNNMSETLFHLKVRIYALRQLQQRGEP